MCWNLRRIPLPQALMNVFLKKLGEDEGHGEVTQQLRALAGVGEDLDLVPSTHIAIYSKPVLSCPKGSDGLCKPSKHVH